MSRSAVAACLLLTFAFVVAGCGGGDSSSPDGSATGASPVVTPSTPVTWPAEKYPNEVTGKYSRTVDVRAFWEAFSLKQTGYTGWFVSGDVTASGTTVILSAVVDKRTELQGADVFNSIGLRESSGSYGPFAEYLFWSEAAALQPKFLLIRSMDERCVVARKDAEFPVSAEMGQAGRLLSGDLNVSENNACTSTRVGGFVATWSLRSFEDEGIQVCDGAGLCRNKVTHYFCIDGVVEIDGAKETTTICFEVDDAGGVGRSARWYERADDGSANLKGFGF